MLIGCVCSRMSFALELDIPNRSHFLRSVYKHILKTVTNNIISSYKQRQLKQRFFLFISITVYCHNRFLTQLNYILYYRKRINPEGIYYL